MKLTVISKFLDYEVGDVITAESDIRDVLSGAWAAFVVKVTGEEPAPAPTEEPEADAVTVV